MKRLLLIVAVLHAGCSLGPSGPAHRMIPAEEFTKAYYDGRARNFSIFRAEEEAIAREAAGQTPSQITPVVSSGDRYVEQGLAHHGGFGVPSPQYAFNTTGNMIPAALQPPPASSAPYHHGPMTSNPSLWPDEAQGASLFRDFRAFQPMDLITIVVDEMQEGRKKAETDTESKFSLTAAIKEFFGIETKKWVANNTSLDPSELISASTDVKFEGEGETQRSGTLRGNISAVIMETLPNGLLRIEGSKIISVNSEEEIMVISGLVRPRDVDARNQVNSSRIANMRVDFYGRGVVGDKQSPGWGARIFDKVWPF